VVSFSGFAPVRPGSAARSSAARGGRAGRARRSTELEAAELEAAKLEADLHRTAATRGPSSCRRRARASAPPWPPSSPHCRGRRELEVGREKGGSSRPGGRREGVGGWRGKRAALTAGRPPPSAAGESRGREIFSFFFLSALYWRSTWDGEMGRGEVRCWPSCLHMSSYTAPIVTCAGSWIN